MGKFQDLSGMKFGKLTVIEKDLERSKKSATYWKCQCECGNITSVNSSKLKNGYTKSCGCLRNKPSVHRIDYTNKKIGRLTAKYPMKENGRLYWVCDCDCGNKDVKIISDKLGGSNPTQSCGCLQREATKKRFDEDLTGFKWNELTVIERDFEKENSTNRQERRWKCKCSCGNIISIPTGGIKTKRQISCGCIKSKGEYFISIYLNKINLKYDSQVSYEDLIGTGGKKLSYDFYIPDYNLLIEFQGDQHKRPCRFPNCDNEQQFKIQQEHDKRKREYAKEHNIELLEIWYYDYDNIENILENKIKELKERLNNE